MKYTCVYEVCRWQMKYAFRRMKYLLRKYVGGTLCVQLVEKPSSERKGDHGVGEEACEHNKEDEREKFALSLSQPLVASSLSEGALCSDVC